MEQPVRSEGAPPPTPASDDLDLSPYLLSRDYEDHLDWLENQRDTRVKRTGRRRFWLGAFTGVAALVASLGGTMLRRR